MKKTIFALTLLFVIFSKAHSSTVFSPFLKELFENNSQLKVAQKQKNIAQLNYKKSYSYYFPEISLESSYMNSSDVLGSSVLPPRLPGEDLGRQTSKIYSTHLQFLQPIWLGGKILAGITLAKLVSKESQHQYKKQKNDIISKLILSLYSLSFLEAQREVLKNSEKSYVNLVQLNRKKLSTGNSLAYELYQSQAELFSYRSRLKALSQQIKRSQEQLKTLLEKEKAPSFSKIKLPVPFVDEEIKAMFPRSKKALFEQARLNNADYQISEKTVSKAKAQKKVAMAEHKPSVSLSYRYGSQAEDVSNLWDKDSRDRRWTVF